MNHRPTPPLRAARWRAAVLVLCLSGWLSACRPSSAPPVPQEVRAAVVQRLAEAGIDAGSPAQAPGLFTAADLSAQAVPDWIVDYGQRPDGRLCGTGGCPLQVWVRSTAGTYVLAFDRPVLAHAVARDDSGRRWLAVDLHGALCQDTGSSACRYLYAWRPLPQFPGGYFEPASRPGQPARYEGPLVPALPLAIPAGRGADQALAGYRRACQAAGGLADLADALVLLPDLNGDGRPELLFDAAQASCAHDDEPVAVTCGDAPCLSQLFGSTAAGDWQPGGSAPPFGYAIDFSGGRGPQLKVHPLDCETDCAEQTVAWQAQERRFRFGVSR